MLLKNRLHRNRLKKYILIFSHAIATE